MDELSLQRERWMDWNSSMPTTSKTHLDATHSVSNTYCRIYRHIYLLPTLSQLVISYNFTKMRGTLKICHTAVWTVSSESSSFTSQFHCPLHPSFLLKNKVCSIRLCTGWLSWAAKERSMAQNRDARLAGHPVNIPMIHTIRLLLLKNKVFCFEKWI